MITALGTVIPETGTSFPNAPRQLERVSGIIIPESPDSGTRFPLTRSVFAFDWGHGNKCVVAWITPAGAFRAHAHPEGLVKFIEENPGVDIILEATAGSFDPDVRTMAVMRAQELNVRLLTVPTRSTPRVRKGMRRKKSDKNDAIALLRYWQLGRHLSVLRPLSVHARNPHLEHAIQLRAGGWPAEAVAKYLSYLPPAVDTPEDYRIVLVDGKKRKKYRVSFVLPLVAAALDSKNRKNFDRLVGAYEHGYPRYTRSNFYHWRVPAVERRIKDHKKALQITRKATRWVYSQVTRLRAEISPTMGTQIPGASDLEEAP